VKVSKKGR